MNGRPVYETWDESVWRELFESVVEKTLLDGENAEDVVAGGWILGEERARIFERPLQPGLDVPYGLSLLCWWPLKYQSLSDNWEYISTRRWNLFRDAKSNPDLAKTKLLNAVPRDVLTLDQHQLLGLLRVVHIRDILNLG